MFQHDISIGTNPCQKKQYLIFPAWLVDYYFKPSFYSNKYYSLTDGGFKILDTRIRNPDLYFEEMVDIC
jgi:hypothetical protein